MITFKMIKEYIKKSGDDSLLSVFNALLFADMDDILDFAEDRMYNTGDIVYINSDEYPYHLFYEACVDNILGQFDESEWHLKNFNMNESNKCQNCIGDIITVRITITTESYSINLSEYNISKRNGKEIMVFKNDTILDNTQYYINNNHLEFFTQLSTGDVISFFIISTSGKAVYKSHNEYITHIGPTYALELSFSDYIGDDFILIIGPNGLLIQGEDFTVNSNSIVFNTTINQKVSINMFGKEGDYNSCMIDNILFDKSSTSFSINAKTWDHNKDELILYSSLKGIISKSTLSFNNNVVTCSDGFETNELVSYIALMSDHRAEKYNISINDLSPNILNTFLNPNRDIITSDYIFTIDDCIKTIDISSLGITSIIYNIDYEVLSNTRGDICFSFYDKTTSSFIAKYGGLADDITVRFRIKQ